MIRTKRSSYEKVGPLRIQKFLGQVGTFQSFQNLSCMNGWIWKFQVHAQKHETTQQYDMLGSSNCIDPTFKDSEKKTCDIDFLNSGVQRKKQHQTSQTSGTRIFSLGLTIKVDVIRHLKDWAKLRSQKSKGWALLVSYMGEPHQDLKGLRVQGTTEDLPSDDLWVVLPTQPFTGPSLRSTW